MPNELWCSTPVNHTYQVCDTYTNRLFVPASLKESTVIGSAKFRSKGRLPALS